MLAYLFLFLRIIFLALERITVKKLGDFGGNTGKNIAATFLFFFIGAISLIPFVFNERIESGDFIVPVLINGVIYSLYASLYVISLARGEASVVTPVSSLGSLVLLFLSVIFLGESFNISKITGILLIIFGLSYIRKTNNFLASMKSLFKEKAVLIMLAAVTIQSFGRILDKLFIIKINPVTYVFFLYLMVSFYLFMYLAFKGESMLIFSLLKAKSGWALASGIINGYSYYFLMLAIKDIELSLAEPLSQTSMIITVLLSAVFFNEKIKDKVAGALIILLGGWLLFLDF